MLSLRETAARMPKANPSPTGGSETPTTQVESVSLQGAQPTREESDHALSQHQALQQQHHALQQQHQRSAKDEHRLRVDDHAYDWGCQICKAAVRQADGGEMDLDRA